MSYRVLALVASLPLAFATPVSAEQPIKFAPVAHYAGPDGGWDYLAVDEAAKRLYVARNYGVFSVDLATGKVTDKLVAGDGVHGVLPLPGSGLVVSANGKSDSVTLFDGASGKVEAEIKAGAKPDGLVFEPKTGLVAIFNAKSRDASLLDPQRREILASIALDGKPEAAVADGAGRMFVNLEDKAEIVALDAEKREVVARYRLPGCDAPTGLAYDSASGLLIAACDNKKAKAIEAATGKDVATLDICAGPDGALLDATRRRVLIPCADGHMSVVSLDGAPKTVADITTAPRAKTGAIDAAGRVYLGTAHFNPPEKQGGKPMATSGTFEILVFSESKSK